MQPCIFSSIGVVGRPHPESHVARRTPRARHPQPQADRCAGRCRAPSAGPRHAQRQAPRVGRPGPSASCSLHGRAGRFPSQSGDPRLLPTPARGLKTEETRAHRLHANMAHDPQRHDANSDRVASDASASEHLTSETVALATPQDLGHTNSASTFFSPESIASKSDRAPAGVVINDTIGTTSSETNVVA